MQIIVEGKKTKNDLAVMVIRSLCRKFTAISYKQFILSFFGSNESFKQFILNFFGSNEI